MPRARCPLCNEFLSVPHVLVSYRGLAELRTRILGSKNLRYYDEHCFNERHIDIIEGDGEK